MRSTRAVLVILVLGLACGARGGDLSIVARGSVTLPSATQDQFGGEFTITGLSGVTFLDDDTLICVLDNSDKLVFVDIALGPDGMIADAQVTGGLTLDRAADFEDIALACGTLVLSAEDLSLSGLFSGDLVTGTLAPLDVPPVYAQRRGNRGFEAMDVSPGGRRIWYANEEALTVDGPVATDSNGTVVRLSRASIADGPVTAVEAMYAYDVDPMHGPALFGMGQSGLVAVVALPGGRLLAVERSVAGAAILFQTRIYEVLFGGATDVGDIGGLAGATYVAVGKRALLDGSFGNMEGLALGPSLASGGRSMIGVVDDGDGLSGNDLVAFELTGLCVCETDEDAAQISIGDLLVYLGRWFRMDSDAEVSGDCPALIGVDDLLQFLACWFEGQV